MHTEDARHAMMHADSDAGPIGAILRRSRILPEDEVNRLAPIARDPDHPHYDLAREKMVLHAARMAYTCVRKHYMSWSGKLPNSADPSDVFQAAMIGLMRAIDLYDETRGIKFTTFAMWHIEQRARRATLAQIGPYKIPERRLYGDGRDVTIQIFAKSLDARLDDPDGDEMSTLEDLESSTLATTDDDYAGAWTIQQAMRLADQTSVGGMPGSDVLRLALDGYNDEDIAAIIHDRTGTRVTRMDVDYCRERIAKRIEHLVADDRADQDGPRTRKHRTRRPRSISAGQQTLS